MVTVEQQVKPKTTNFFWERIRNNIFNDHLEFFVITSQSAGFHASDGIPFGAGKSTFGIGSAYRAFAMANGTLKLTKNGLVDITPEKKKLQMMRLIVLNYVKFTLTDVTKALKHTSIRLPAIVWDDTQKTAPSYQHIPKHIREQIERLTMARQKLANLIMTTPSISDIAKPLRRNISLEIIIPKRGTYEIQFLRKRRNFRRPVDDYSKMHYVGRGTFGKLPEEIDQLYKELRQKAFEEAGADGSEEFEDEVQNMGHKVTCKHCGYTWMTRSDKLYVSCTNCRRKTQNQGGY